MPLFIQIPENISDIAREVLSSCGFRWCTKDKRWESKRKLSSVDDMKLRVMGLCPHKYGKGNDA